MTPRNARKSPHVRDGGDSVVSAARRRKLSRWRANADMIDSCCWSESAVAVVAKGTGSYLTGVWLIELLSGVAIAHYPSIISLKGREYLSGHVPLITPQKHRIKRLQVLGPLPVGE